MNKQIKFIIGIAFILSAISYSVSAQTDTTKLKMEKMSFGDKIEFIKNMEILDISPENVPDGTYIGEFPFMNNMVYRLSIAVKSGKIMDINVLKNGTGNDRAKKGLDVIDSILKEQSPKVDAVSGSTITSKSLMKCVEKALRNNTETKKD